MAFEEIQLLIILHNIHFVTLLLIMCIAFFVFRLLHLVVYDSWPTVAQ